MVVNAVGPEWLDSCHSFLVATHSAQVDVLAAAIAAEHQGCCLEAVDIVIVLGVVAADEVGEAVAASSDYATVGEFAGLARPVLVVVEEAPALDVQGQETRMSFQRHEQSAAILQEVEVLVELAAPAHCAAVGASIVPAVPWRTRLAKLLESRTKWISVPMSASHAVMLNAPARMLSGAWHTYIPVLRPLSQVRVVDPAVSSNMLARAHDHVL